MILHRQRDRVRQDEHHDEVLEALRGNERPDLILEALLGYVSGVEDKWLANLSA